MPQSLFRSRKVQDIIFKDKDITSFVEKLKSIPVDKKPLPGKIPARNIYSNEGLKKRQKFLRGQGIKLDALNGDSSQIPSEDLKGNIENLIGFCQIPVGVIGPLRINGINAKGDFYIPLATTEGTLVASYNRGAHVISQSGGASAACLTESVSRAPCFVFNNIIDAGLFLNWVLPRVEEFSEIIRGTTRHGKLIDLRPAINGPVVYLIFEYSTGDASGQNMVTIATEAVCRKLLDKSPIKPDQWYIEGNLSGDKKASMLSFMGVRGKKVIAETIIPEKIVNNLLHTTAQHMARYYSISTIGGIQSGQIGIQGHYANALGAIYIACGQDAACVSESSIGITDLSVNKDGDLHVTVSLPNLTVGTIGGGTYLPTAKECLEMMGCYGKGKARKFAEICAVTAMAGEISIIAAMTSGHFSTAHETYRHKT